MARARSPGNKPAPIDALVVTKTLGKGRIVLCQIPLARGRAIRGVNCSWSMRWITWLRRSCRRRRPVAGRARSSSPPAPQLFHRSFP